jgi:signal peptide peptidase SppA
MKYQDILAEVCSKPWAILPEKLATIVELIHFQAEGGKLTAVQAQELIGSGQRSRPSVPGMVALIPIYGLISRRVNIMSQIFGGTTIDKLQSSFRMAMADPNVKAIVFDVDSPGGSVDGVPEFADEVFAGRKDKKIIAVADTMAASAAFWIASQAGEMIVTQSGSVGSIGIFAEHDDVSKASDMAGVKTTLIAAGKYKIEGNPYEPLSDKARGSIQYAVDSFYGMFTKAVARGRGVSQTAVRDGYGQGRMVLAAAAVRQGMADSVDTMDATLARFGVSKDQQRVQPAKRLSSLAMLERELAMYEATGKWG